MLAIDRDHGAGGGRDVQPLDLRAPQLDRLAVRLEAGARERIEGADAAFDDVGRQRPGDRRLGLGDLVGIAGAGLRLRHRPQPAGGGVGQRLHDHARAERGQAVVQLAGGVVEPDRLAFDQQHVASVQAGVHLHDRDAGLGVAGLDRAVDRRGAAPARQQRAVDVQAAQSRQRQHPFGQDQAVGGHHQHVRACRVQRGAARRGLVRKLAVQAQAARLRDRNAQVERQLLDRRRRQLHAAAGRAVGLGEHQRYVVAGGVDRGECHRSELGRPGKSDAQHGVGHQRLRTGCSSRVFLSILVLMRSRLSGLR